jgi:hypothetical protein
MQTLYLGIVHLSAFHSDGKEVECNKNVHTRVSHTQNCWQLPSSEHMTEKRKTFFIEAASYVMCYTNLSLF